MKTRIIGELAEMTSPESQSSMAAELSASLNLNRLQLQERSLLVLRSILHDYYHFAVTTIDSFFQKVILGFAREIGLQGGYEVEMDTDKVLSEVTDLMFSELGDDPKLLDWLVQFSDSIMKEERGWDVRKEIVKLGKEIFRESYAGIREKLDEEESQSPEINRLRDKIAVIKFSFEKDMKKMAGEAAEVIRQKGYSVEDFSNRKAGVAGYFQNIIDGKYDYGSRVEKALQDPSAWLSKSSPLKDELIPFIKDELLPRLRRIVEYYDHYRIAYYSTDELYRYLYTFGLLSNLTSKLGHYRDEHGAILISDLSLFLKEITGNNDAPFIYEKAGIFYDHFLIDEFQDTSRVQWENFSPLVKNSLAQGNLNLVVGDVKQSVYRWRGSDWRILDHDLEENIGDVYIRKFNLSKNWRSREYIIRFNNEFFSRSVSLLSQWLENEIPEEGNSQSGELTYLSNAYADLLQELPEQKGNNPEGYVNIRFVDANEEEEVIGGNFRSTVLKKLPALFEEVQDGGIRPCDMAILVRNNSEGKEVARYMLEFAGSPDARKGYKYEVVSSESLTLGVSSSVNVLVNALKYINNPEDDLAGINLVFYYRKASDRDNAASWHESFQSLLTNAKQGKITFDSFPPEFTGNLQGYSSYPLNELVSKLIPDLRMDSLKGELPYLLGFQDAVNEFTTGNRSDISSFLEWWEEEGCEQSIHLPDNQEAARILTIHKAKGLEFRFVIIPFCNWMLDLDARKDNILWMEAKKAKLDFDLLLPVKYSKNLTKTYFIQEYFREKIMSFIDNLNLLYVAFTRASEGIRVFAPLPKPTKQGIRPDKTGNLLYNILENNQESYNKTFGLDIKKFWNAEEHIFESGELNPSAKPAGPADEYTLDSYSGSGWQSRISFRRSAENVFVENNQLKKSRLNKGVIIHEILSEIITKNDLDKAIGKALSKGIIDTEEAGEVKLLIEDLLHQPLISDWFSGEWEIKTEAPVIPAPGELNRMDRVMFRENAVIVLDYKTGQPRKQDKDQVRNYINILGQMNYSKVEGYLLYVDNGKLERVGL